MKRKINLALKRTFDVVVSFTMILMLMIIPVFEVIYLAIRISSGSPVIFKQTRIGKNKVPFQMYKFRTMILEQYDKNGKEIMSEDRITKIGKILRKTSLDELPQLFNVLNGSMSFIGPRPMLDYQAEKCDENESKRFGVRPGLTGWAQVNGRNNIPWSLRIPYDLEYVEKFSVFFDVKIFFKTFSIVSSRTGTQVEPDYRGMDKFSKHYHENDENENKETS